MRLPTIWSTSWSSTPRTMKGWLQHLRSSIWMFIRLGALPAPAPTLVRSEREGNETWDGIGWDGPLKRFSTGGYFRAYAEYEGHPSSRQAYFIVPVKNMRCTAAEQRQTFDMKKKSIDCARLSYLARQEKSSNDSLKTKRKKHLSYTDSNTRNRDGTGPGNPKKNTVQKIHLNHMRANDNRPQTQVHRVTYLQPRHSLNNKKKPKLSR